MGAQKGKDLLLKVDTGVPGVYVTVAGLRSRKIAFNSQTVDVTDQDSAGRWRELLAGAGVQRASISGSGIFKDAQSDAKIREAFFAGAISNWQVVVPDFGTVQGPFQISALEYSGSNLAGIFAQGRNIASPRFWSMLRDLLRFYREAPLKVHDIDPGASLDEYLNASGFGAAFREDHLYPMAAAIWSTPAFEIGNYPAVSFIRFCENHGLLKLFQRPVWRTVESGSQAYVERLVAGFRDRIRVRAAVTAIRRVNGAVEVTVPHNEPEWFDHVLIGAHAYQALNMLSDPSNEETELLGAFKYGLNETVLHTDTSLMPKLRRVWSSWNYIAQSSANGSSPCKPCVTYWMNNLQGLTTSKPVFVTLSPLKEPCPESVLWRGTYAHPLFDGATLVAQKRLWSLQGVRNTWFCGSYFGSGFHEDAIQAGLGAGEALGGVTRPWAINGQSGRIYSY